METALEHILDAVRHYGSNTKAYEQLGNIHVNLHPNGELLIFNYTHKAAAEKTWTPIERICRGLIIHWPTATVRARAFDKFFNLGEMPETQIDQLPKGQVEITSKMDGSMGISYWDGDYWAIATRGSFTSPQAIWATEWLREYLDTSRWQKDTTYIFEIIYPENRIVVDYKGFSYLVLIGYRDNETGFDHWHETFQYFGSHDRMRVVERLYFDSLEAVLVKSQTLKGEEGWVIRYSNGLRVKIKTEEYLRLHHLVTGVTERTIWEHLRDGKSIGELITETPTDFTNWVLETWEKLRNQFKFYESGVRECLDQLEMLPTRKEQAAMILNKEHHWIAGALPGVAFAMLDGKPYSRMIWNYLYPYMETKIFTGSGMEKEDV